MPRVGRVLATRERVRVRLRVRVRSHGWESEGMRGLKSAQPCIKALQPKNLENQKLQSLTVHALDSPQNTNNPPMPPQRATIIGLGLSGALLALSLHRYTSTIPTIYELRASPSTLGGAINLTPPVSRILASLDLLAAAKEIAFETKEIGIFSLRSGAKLGGLPFIDEETGHTSLRIERALLLELLIRALEEAGVQVVFGKRVEGVREVDEGRVAAVFADGGEVESELLFGCDGIHSLVRGSYVEPDRKATYSGLSSAYGFSATPEGLAEKEGFEGTAVASGMRGSVIVSYCGPRKEKVFVGAVMEVKAPDADRDGWRGKGAMGTEAKKELVERFGGGDPVFKAVVEGVEEWSFFPVWVLPNGGTYWRGRTVLVGDAAHAVRFYLDW